MALLQFHRAGILHRDVNPRNIWRHEDGTFLLLDLGLARRVEDTSVTILQGFTGSIGYTALEQAHGEPCPQGRSDLFSLGAVVYQALTGTCPFTGTSKEAYIHSLDQSVPIAPSTRNAKIPAPLSNLVLRLLRKNVDERFASVDQLLDALASVKERNNSQRASQPNHDQADERLELSQDERALLRRMTASAVQRDINAVPEPISIVIGLSRRVQLIHQIRTIAQHAVFFLKQLESEAESMAESFGSADRNASPLLSDMTHFISHHGQEIEAHGRRARSWSISCRRN